MLILFFLGAFRSSELRVWVTQFCMHTLDGHGLDRQLLALHGYRDRAKNATSAKETMAVVSSVSTSYHEK